jgi:curved DNA-binding protein CbpA
MANALPPSLPHRGRIRRNDARSTTKLATGFSRLHCLLVSVWLFLQSSLGSSNVLVTAAKTEDLYKLLGVPRTATTKEIKSAYRRKALDTHPDKNLHLDPTVAAETFHKVVHAFEVLSDEQKRRHYDQTGQDPGEGGGNQNNHGYAGQHSGFTGFRWSQQYGFQFNYPPVRLKDKFEVKQAMSRVLHVSSITHFETVMFDMDSDGINRLERNVIMAFCTPQIETHLDDEMVFPYPFAGMSSQRIWWEDLLQTVKVRFHRKNDLAELFGIPMGNDMKAPHFVFGKRGQTLEEPWQQFSTRDRGALENWIWERIQVEVIFMNHHVHPVELYWIDGSLASKKETIPPGHQSIHTTMLSHEWWVRDARTETLYNQPLRTRLSQETCLGSWKIVNDTSPHVIVIETPECFDLSGHCAFWKHNDDACNTNPGFMCTNCQLTCREACGLCDEEKRRLEEANSGQAEVESDEGLHQPSTDSAHDEL